MPSVFGHSIAAFANGKSIALADRKKIILGVICSILPDADVLAFNFGIPYQDVFGHRGFFHSLLFAFLLGCLIVLVFYSSKLGRRQGYWLILFFACCTASHPLLDAMTSGGLGVAFFSPWDNTRYFLPWRPIKVSPIGVESFFTARGWMVLKSELAWIAVPAGVAITLSMIVRRLIGHKKGEPQNLKL